VRRGRPNGHGGQQGHRREDDALPMDPLMIKLGQTGGGSGHDGGSCTLGAIYTGVRSSNTIVGAGVLKPKSMVAQEKGLAGARAALWAQALWL
jgi:hypothetical protein